MLVGGGGGGTNRGVTIIGQQDDCNSWTPTIGHDVIIGHQKMASGDNWALTLIFKVLRNPFLRLFKGFAVSNEILQKFS